MPSPFPAKRTMRSWPPITAVCLTAGAFLSLAQSNGASADKPKEVRFEVLSIKPIRADDPAYSGAAGNSNPSPNGFVSRLSVFQLIMLAYAPGDFTTWGGVPTRNMPGGSGDFSGWS